MSYTLDKPWLEAKKVCKENGLANNWVEVISYYNLNQGLKKSLVIIKDYKEKRIIGISDNNKVVTMDKKELIEEMDYEEAVVSKKKFYSLEKVNIKSLKLNKNTKILGKNTIDINIG